MWDAIAMVNYQYKDWQGQSWRRIKADSLFESNKVLQL
jgi:dynein heavy chain, axonemal